LAPNQNTWEVKLQFLHFDNGFNVYDRSAE